MKEQLQVVGAGDISSAALWFGRAPLLGLHLQPLIDYNSTQDGRPFQVLQFMEINQFRFWCKEKGPVTCPGGIPDCWDHLQPPCDPHQAHGVLSSDRWMDGVLRLW